MKVAIVKNLPPEKLVTLKQNMLALSASFGFEWIATIKIHITEPRNTGLSDLIASDIDGDHAIALIAYCVGYSNALSDAARRAGSVISKRKSESSAANGRKGGRPRKQQRD